MTLDSQKLSTYPILMKKEFVRVVVYQTASLTIFNTINNYYFLINLMRNFRGILYLFHYT